MTTPGGAGAPATGKPGAGAAVVGNRFVNATRVHTEPAFDVTATMTTGNVALGPFDVPAYGFARRLWLQVTCTTAGNAATTAFRENGPWAALQDIAFVDTNGAPIWGPMSGFDLFLAAKYGGYDFDADPTRSPAYSVTTGAGATGGSFSFLISIPLEIVERDAFGVLPNMNAGSPYRLRLSIGPSAGVYSTAPTTLGSVRVRAWLDAYMLPTQADARGVPNEQYPAGLGTAQFWRKQTFPIVSGNNTLRISQVGNLIRTLVFVVYDNASPAIRQTNNFPADFTLSVDGLVLHQHARELQRHIMGSQYGYTGTALDNGVYVFSFASEFDGKPGNELRDMYLPTNTATRLELVGSFGGVGSCDVLVNDVVPAAA
jgi:hypothetical protein